MNMQDLSGLRQIVIALSFALLPSMPLGAQQQPVLESGARGDQERAVQYPDADEKLEAQTRAERGEALERRAGEQIGGDARGRAGVLGMYLQEGDGDQATVVDVGVATPAFDAGIRKGDVIISFDAFKANSYRQWVDGMRKLVRDAAEGDTLPIQLQRDGKLLNLRLRKPIARADDVRLGAASTTTQPATPLDPSLGPPIAVPQQPVQPSAGYGGGDVFAGDFFGGQFSDVQGGATDVAMAEIFPVGRRQSDITTPAGQALDARKQSQADSTAPPTAENPPTEPRITGQRGLGGTPIGMAGFRNAENGLLVMLEVGGLPAGNYRVGIGDAGTLNTGAVDATPGGNVQRTQSHTGRPAPSERGVDPRIPTDMPPIGESPREGQLPANRGTSPGQRQAPRRAQPQSRHEQVEVPATVLAQVIEGADADSSAADTTGGAPAIDDDAAATGASGAAPAQPATPASPATPAQPLDIPPTGQVGPIDTPATGRSDLPDTPATGVAPSPQDARTGDRASDVSRQGAELADGTANVGIDDSAFDAGIGPTINVGLLTVDQSGVGRLQQVVEGIQVQHVVGQAIVIYGEDVPPNTMLPPNLNTTGQAEATQPTAAGQAAPVQGVGNRGLAPPATNPAVSQPATAGQAIGTQGPVASGMIRMVSDRRPPTGQQPAAGLPASRQELR